MNITGRDKHIIDRALALALEIYSRATPKNTPQSDVDDMARLYLARTSEADRRGYEWSNAWLLAGGLDLRERKPEPLPTGGGLSPEPAPGGGERIAA